MSHQECEALQAQDLDGQGIGGEMVEERKGFGIPPTGRETLHLIKGEYYLQLRPSEPRPGLSGPVRSITKKEAAEWLIKNGHDLPDDLAKEALGR